MKITTNSISGGGGGVRTGALVNPETPYTTDTAGNLFPYLYTGAGGNVAPSDWNQGVVASLGSDVVLQMRFMMPTFIPKGTFKLYSWCKANATTGNALYTPSDGFAAAGTSESAVTLTTDAQVTVSPTVADVPILSKTTLSSTPAALGVLVVAITFNHTSWTLAQILACRFYVGWE